MVTIQVRRLLGQIVVLAAVIAGSFGLSTTAASACTGSPNCSGVPPVQATLTSCTNPNCISGTPPVRAALLSSCPDPDCIKGIPPAAQAAFLGGCTEPPCVGGVPPVAARLGAAID